VFLWWPHNTQWPIRRRRDIITTLARMEAGSKMAVLSFWMALKLMPCVNFQFLN